MRQDGEPTVEDILESIKKVIARDNRETLRAERRRRSDADIESEIIEPAHEDEAEDVLELGEADAEMATDHLDTSGLITESVARSTRESLAALAMLSEPGAAPQIVRSGETSLEGLVRELLRPMLAQWLDRNLPDMVDRLVKAEITRIAGKKG